MNPNDPEPTLSPARYAKGKVAVAALGVNGFKSRAGRLAEVLNGRYSNRERAYIMSPLKAQRLAKLWDEGWDACVFTKQLVEPSC